MEYNQVFRFCKKMKLIIFYQRISKTYNWKGNNYEQKNISTDN